MTKDFLNATEGHSTVMNFSTIPAGCSRPTSRSPIPRTPIRSSGTTPKAQSCAIPPASRSATTTPASSVGTRKGGFTDENGKRHDSGYHYHFPVWEVLNEVDFEHKTTPELYTQRYDAIVAAIHKVSPETKFMGLALAAAAARSAMVHLLPRSREPRAGHAARLHLLSLLCDAADQRNSTTGNTPSSIRPTAFSPTSVTWKRFASASRPRPKPISTSSASSCPRTSSKISDRQSCPDHIPHLYWNAAGSLYAYLFIDLSKQGIDIIGESQLVGYPSQFPSVSMMDWKNGKPNARYWVLKLIKDNFHSGDTLVNNRVQPTGATSTARPSTLLRDTSSCC